MNKGQIFAERKSALLQDIRVSRNHLAVYQQCQRTFGKDWTETVELEHDYFKSLLERLIRLKRWGRQHGIQA